jgi:mannose-1-phosphate guanylyltransferase
MTNAWAIILAGGDGIRLRSVAESLTGDSRPKQFCALLGDQPLLDQTLRRAALSVRSDHHVVVVTQHHAPYWAPLARALPRTHLVVQPDNRGTAVALLLAFHAIEEMAGDVPVIILPSDHDVSDDNAFMAHVDAALRWTSKCAASPILLGVDASYAETEYGWIEPARLASTPHGSIHPVRRFWEKPNAAIAQTLLRRGCLWNSMVMVGRVGAFLRMTQATIPDLPAILEPLRWIRPGPARERQLERIYADLPVLGFSERVLAARPEYCLVHRVSGVRWTDLGSPARVFEVLRRSGRHLPLVKAAPSCARESMVPASIM